MVEDHDLTNIPKVDWRKFKNSMIPDPTLPKTPVKIDYLYEWRRQWALKEQNSSIYSSADAITWVSSQASSALKAHLMDS